MDTDSFGEVMAAAMERRGATLADLRERLTDRGHSVSLSALSYWRSGQRMPQRQTSLEAIPELEAILGLDEGDLLGRIPSTLQRKTLDAVPFNDLVGVETSEPLQSESFLFRASAHIVVDVGAHREIASAVARTVLVATRDGVEKETLYYHGDPGTDDLVVRALGGCRTGESTQLEGGIQSLELLFDRPLARDEQVVTEIELTHRGLDLDTSYSLATGSALEEALLWVRFHPDCLPRRCWLGFTEDGAGYEWPVELAGGRSLMERQTAFGPGRIDARWEW
ncbi:MULTISPECIES: hypothetical protein [Pimelobacter]|uniref:hypothetical protein n=1 Tax=Pimelobacter TaxID=2044 RepID=UPI001C040CFC|nr:MULTISPECIES: hypothetical protein [Pimelobacter]MBU2695462.1 hypothetical protein [Pimelobacter sp. 30-1]UUW91163.1 hypothetical protein M0M43_06680 [Pimelobacter simplex]UUW94991.1 hypothetical protein M0M48_25185 [Pimelobacter simplex]